MPDEVATNGQRHGERTNQPQNAATGSSWHFRFGRARSAHGVLVKGVLQFGYLISLTPLRHPLGPNQRLRAPILKYQLQQLRLKEWALGFLI